MKSLRQFSDEAATAYERFREEILPTVVRWVYADGPRFSFGPIPWEACGVSAARETKSPDHANYKYGFDVQDRLVYEWRGFASNWWGESFHLRESNAVFLVSYDCRLGLPAKLGGIQRLVLGADGRAVSFVAGSGIHALKQIFTWSEDRLVRIDRSANYGKERSDRQWSAQRLVYDVVGKLEQVWNIFQGQESIYFRRPPKGVTQKSLEEALQKRLLELVPKVVAAGRIEEPVYCLVLAYDGEGNGAFPPCLGLGLESERRKWIAEKGKEAKHFVWNPAEFAHYEKSHTQFNDKQLEELSELYNQIIEAKGSFTAPVKLLNEIATALAATDWSGLLQTTPDFVVYAVDFELGDLAKNFKKSAPAALLAKFKAEKLL